MTGARKLFVTWDFDAGDLRVADYADRVLHPFALVEESWRDGQRGAPRGALRAALTAAAREPGRVWLLFDGLDELPSERAVGVLRRLEALARQHPACVFLLTARPPGPGELGSWTLRARLAPP